MYIIYMLPYIYSLLYMDYTWKTTYVFSLFIVFFFNRYGVTIYTDEGLPHITPPPSDTFKTTSTREYKCINCLPHDVGEGST